ncbi:MAG: hypothetical protein AB1480_02740 [Nitrospirota bacterium]
MKRILFPIGEREMLATQGRLMYLPERIASPDVTVDIITYSNEVFEKTGNFWKNNNNINVVLSDPNPLVIPADFRDNLVKIFIPQIKDILIPDTDLSLWKVAAFDDFRGHISSFTFPDLKGDYDLMLLPFPSFDEPPPDKSDAFYSTIIFLAKERGIPIVALQIYPVFNTPVLFVKIADYFIVKSEFERQYYEQRGIEKGKIFILNDIKDCYCLDTIEDVYKNLLFDEQIKKIELTSDELVVLIINHPRFRAQIKEILKLLGSLNTPKTVFFLKRGYHVRDLSEDQIINDLIREDLKRIKGRFFIAEDGSLVTLLMLSDLIISTSYIIPLQFASKYNKVAVVFNPLFPKTPSHNGVTFINNLNVLLEVISLCISAKKTDVSIGDILKKVRV